MAEEFSPVSFPPSSPLSFIPPSSSRSFHTILGLCLKQHCRQLLSPPRSPGPSPKLCRRHLMGLLIPPDPLSPHLPSSALEASTIPHPSQGPAFGEAT